MMSEAVAVGSISVKNAVKVEIIDIERRGLFRRLAVLMKWTVVNQKPEYRWVYPGEFLITNIDVAIKPEV